MKRNLQMQFFHGFTAFSPFHKNFTLHNLGPGHPGTLELPRSADPPGNPVQPDHRPSPLHGDDRPPALLHGEVFNNPPCNIYAFYLNEKYKY